MENTLHATLDGQAGLNENRHLIVLAGASGALGNRIAIHLIKSGAKVSALVRSESPADEIEKIAQAGRYYNNGGLQQYFRTHHSM